MPAWESLLKLSIYMALRGFGVIWGVSVLIVDVDVTPCITRSQVYVAEEINGTCGFI